MGAKRSRGSPWVNGVPLFRRNLRRAGLYACRAHLSEEIATTLATPLNSSAKAQGKAPARVHAEAKVQERSRDRRFSRSRERPRQLRARRRIAPPSPRGCIQCRPCDRTETWLQSAPEPTSPHLHRQVSEGVVVLRSQVSELGQPTRGRWPRRHGAGQQWQAASPFLGRATQPRALRHVRSSPA